MKKVLLVEGDMPTGQALKHVLEKEKLSVTVVQKGELAFEIALIEKPSVILLGLKLHGKLDGFDVLEQMRMHPILSKTPILIVTNFGLPQDIKRGLDSGAEEYLVKADHSVHEIAKIAAKYAAKQPKN
jgi:DNA-binding response OmpR family regulator